MPIALTLGLGFFLGFFVCARLMEHTYTSKIRALEDLLKEQTPYPRSDKVG